jgi:tRNA-splicing ligase RtcB (3'-phosphate/5'-hydroxy nucleic acid ligase)
MLQIYGNHDQKTINQMHECLKYGSAQKAVLCADGHLGYAHPIGGVIAYTDHISISGVGFDIGCGNMAVRLDVKEDDLIKDYDLIANDIAKSISFGVGRKNSKKVRWDKLDTHSEWDEAGVKDLKTLARDQLGTVGSGNHYVDIFTDEEGFVWIGVHFGSRGLGHKIATKYLALAGGKDGMDVPPALLEIKSDLGRAYLAGMELAGNYAHTGREWVVEQVRDIVGGRVTKSIHNHHNYAWKEIHDGKELYVVRKGATPAFPGQEGFVGGSMGDNAVILEGVDSEVSKASLYSTVHGAGRTMGRYAAKKAFTQEQMDEWVNRERVILRGAGLDESPMAYRRLNEVLDFHKDTVKINHVLKPRVVVMAGAKEIDPYKD